jgi:streptogramin lyase
MNIARAASRGLLLTLAIVLCTGAGAHASTVTEFWEDISEDSRPNSITVGPDNNLWFTEPGVDQVAKITPAGVVTEYFDGITEGSYPLGITSGPDGNVWFTQYDAGTIAKITTAGVVTEFTAGFGPNASPYDIVTGADGNLWYTDTNGHGIGRITPAGVVSEYPITGGLGFGGGAITAGPDNKIWFTASAGVGRIDPAAPDPAATITQFPTGSPIDIAFGPDGNLWTTSYFGPIRRITTAGVVTGTFGLTMFAGQSVSPFGITAGPDANMWFTDDAEDGIGRLVPATGAVAIVSGPIGFGSNPRDIVTGPDGNLWFTQPGYDQVSRMTPTLDPPLATAGDATAITTTTAALNGTVDTRGGISTAVRFEYGPTTAYGSQTPVREAYATSAEAASDALTGLQPATTYHYRLLALNGVGSAQSADRTFTTATPPPPPPPPVAPACSNGRDDDRDGFADAGDARCHADGDRRNAASYRAQSTTESPLDDPVVACSAGGLALTSVELTNLRRTIVLRGVTGAAQAGKQVGIYAAGRRVANPKVAADGSFRATFRAARRAPAQVRYQARLGAKRSQTLAPQRRFAGIRLTVVGGRATLTGRIVLRRPRRVELLGRAGGCGAFKRLATARVRAGGTFSLSAAAFSDVDIATYRVRIAATGAAGVRESTPPRALKLR